MLSVAFGSSYQGTLSEPILHPTHPRTMSSVTGDVTFPFPKDLYLSGNNYWNMTDLLTVNETLDDIPEMVGDGITAYSGSDVVPQISASMFLVKVTFINTTIYNDHDSIPLGAGEIYFNITINGNFTKTENKDINDDETKAYNIQVFYAWCLQLDINIDVWEDDQWPDEDDSLGTYHYQTMNPTSQLINSTTDIGDARLIIQLDVLDTEAYVTAEKLADGCKPYFWITDETSHTEEADEVYSRVLVGYDSTKAKDVICIQYIFYWEEEYFPVPVDVKFHTDDYEEFLIFIDPANLLSPYRYVMDDGSYVSNMQSSRIAIWENSPTTSILETEAYVSDEMMQLLGSNYTTDYKIFNLADATEELRMGLSGITTMNLLVQTSFHNFQEGPPGTFDFSENEIGYNYTIDELSDEKIREYFRNHYEAFEQGLWWISAVGIDTPKVHPFTFDIMDPFQFPYIINGYPNVVDNIELFQKANKNFISYEYEIELTLALLFKARYTITSPDQVVPGEEFDVTIEVEMLENDIEIALLYDFFVNSSIKALFLDKNYLLDYEGKVGVNVPLGTIGNILGLLGMDPFHKTGLNLDTAGYLTLDKFFLAPHLLGNIMEADISLHLWDIMKGILPTFYPATTLPLHVLDWFMDAIDLKLDAVFSGFVNGTIASSNPSLAAITTDEFEFDGTTMSTTTHVTVADEVASTQSFDIVLDDLALIFSFLTDWIFEIDFEPIIALLAPQYAHMIFDLGTFPNVQWGSSDSRQISTGTVEKSTEVNVATETAGTAMIVISTTMILSMIALISIRKFKK